MKLCSWNDNTDYITASMALLTLCFAVVHAIFTGVEGLPNGTYSSDTAVVLFFEVSVYLESFTQGTFDLSGIPDPEYGHLLDVREVKFKFNGTHLIPNPHDTDMNEFFRKYKLPSQQWSALQYDESADAIHVNWNGTIFVCEKDSSKDEKRELAQDDTANGERRLGERYGVDAMFNISRPEGNRSYWIYYPVNITARFILLNLHCMGCTCESWKYGSRLIDYALEYRFIMFTPCGVENALYMKSWNAGSCCHATSAVNDTEFIQAMLKDPRWNLPDWAPVYAVGYSNGAMLAETLMCHNIVSRVVSIAGVLVLERKTAAFGACDAIFNSTDDKRIAHIHGTEDDYVPWGGAWVYPFPPVRASMARWANRMGCDKTFNRTNRFEGRFKYLDWHCPWSRNVSLVRVEGGQHKYYQRRNLDVASYAMRFLTAENP